MKTKKTRTLALVGLVALGILLVMAAPALAWSPAELDKAKVSGVKFIRRDLFPGSQDGGDSQKLVNEAKARGIQVIGIVGSAPFKPYVSFWYLCGWWSWCYHDWGVKWQEYVRTVINENKHWVRDWQIDNELNHPWHNTFTAANTQLRMDIVRMGVQAALQADPYLRATMVNLYWYGDWFHDLLNVTLYRALRDSGVRLDMLGLDIYRATYSSGSPYQYDDDFQWAHSIWQGNMLMTETGFCTFGLRTSEHQANYLVETYTTMNSFQARNPWYKGTLLYESSDAGIAWPWEWWETPIQKCEKTFGLLYTDEIAEKPAWDTFADYNRYCKGYCGLTMH